MSAEQAKKRANASDSAEYTLSAMHARDFQVRLAKRHPARWRLLSAHSPLSVVRVNRDTRESTIKKLALAKCLRPCAYYIGNWYFTGWGLLVREAGTLTRETPE